MKALLQLPLVLLLILAYSEKALPKPASLGDIDRNFSYEDLDLDVHTGYLSGKIINKSTVLQKSIRLKFEAFDVLKNLLWEAVVRIDFINPKEGKNFKQLVSTKSLETPLEIKCINLNSDDENRKKSISDIRDDDYLNISSTRMPLYINGSGKKISDLFIIDRGLIRAKFEHKGNGHFSVWLKDENGRSIELLANEIGKLSGSSSAKIPRKGRYFVDVDANPSASWSINLDKPSPGDYGINSDENKIQIKKGKDGVTYLELNN